MTSLKRCVIFGSTSAIAQAVARELVANGASVFCIGRNPAKLAALLAALRVRAAEGQLVAGEAADLQDCTRHEGLLASAVNALGGLDAVLVAHGTLPDQKACEASSALTLRELETNALSVISILTLAANLLETKGSGVLAAISSVAGDRGRGSNYVYGAAKGALTIFMQGLRNRLAKSGVKVVTIKPGFVDTPMTVSLPKGILPWASPEAVSRGIVRAMRRGTGEVYLPGFWRFTMLIVRHIPSCIFNRMRL